jgi:hypothetical protein
MSSGERVVAPEVEAVCAQDEIPIQDSSDVHAADIEDGTTFTTHVGGIRKSG